MLQKSAIKYIQSLQHKKFRDEYGVFVAEGPKLVEELMEEASFSCEVIYAVDDWNPLRLDERWPLYRISSAELERMSGLVTPNKVIAVFRQRKGVVFSPKAGITLLLDDIRDPGNLGTIIRTADWFGVGNIVCSTETADIYNPKVVQSTMASLGRVNVLYHDLGEWLSMNKGPVVLAATLQGKPLSEVPVGRNAFIIIGNESSGISRELIDRADQCISIPGIGKAESLNAAVAAGIILYGLTSRST